MTVLGAYFVYMKHLILGLVHWDLNGMCVNAVFGFYHGLILTNNKQRMYVVVVKPCPFVSEDLICRKLNKGSRLVKF